MPHFPIERLKREKNGELCPDRFPFALIGSEDGALKLTALNEAAARKGLYPGISLADARAIHPSLLTAPATPEKDGSSLIALARWLRRYSPCLNAHGDDGIWLDATGVPHLFGGEDALLDEMAMRLARFGFTANLALAETLGGAHALARYGRASPIAVPKGRIADALAPLPVEALRLAEEPVRLLSRLGLKRIGQLYDLPRSALERRFHSREAADAVLLRLDQALGKRAEKLRPLLPPNEFAARLPFAEPLITHEGIIAALDALAGELQAQLEAASRGALRLKLTLYRADGSAAVVQAGLSAPSRRARHVARLLADKLADIDAGFGIDLMVLAAPATEVLPPAQASFAKSRRKESEASLIDRLASRLGEEAVQRLSPIESHMPERAQRKGSAFANHAAWPRSIAPNPPRPPLLLSRPEPLSVLAEVPEGAPARFTWRRVTRAVVKAEGPERIAPEWWLTLACRDGITSPIPPPAIPRTRDYYRIEDAEGHRYWVFREGLYQERGTAPEWYLHGVFG